MKCHQCERAALYMVGPEHETPLCLHCMNILSNYESIEFIKNVMMMNNAVDEMDAITGFHTSGGRMSLDPLVQAMRKHKTYNNINITNSQIGVVNTGDLARIDAAITLSQTSDIEPVGNQIKLLTQAVLDSREVEGKLRNELIDLLQSLAEQIVKDRKPSVMAALVASIRNKLVGIAGLIGAADKLADLLQPYLS